MIRQQRGYSPSKHEPSAYAGVNTTQTPAYAEPIYYNPILPVSFILHPQHKANIASRLSDFTKFEMKLLSQHPGTKHSIPPLIKKNSTNSDPSSHFAGNNPFSQTSDRKRQSVAKLNRSDFAQPISNSIFQAKTFSTYMPSYQSKESEILNLKNFKPEKVPVNKQNTPTLIQKAIPKNERVRENIRLPFALTKTQRENAVRPMSYESPSKEKYESSMPAQDNSYMFITDRNMSGKSLEYSKRLSSIESPNRFNNTENSLIRGSPNKNHRVLVPSQGNSSSTKSPIRRHASPKGKVLNRKGPTNLYVEGVKSHNSSFAGDKDSFLQESPEQTRPDEPDNKSLNRFDILYELKGTAIEPEHNNNHEDMNAYSEIPEDDEESTHRERTSKIELRESADIQSLMKGVDEGLKIFDNSSSTFRQGNGIRSPDARNRSSKNRPLSSVGVPIRGKVGKSSLHVAEEREKIAGLKKKLTESMNIGKKLAKTSSISDLSKNNNFGLTEVALPSPRSEEEFPDGISMDIEEEDDVESTMTARTIVRRPMLLNSVYDGRPRTIFFQYHRCCEKTRDTSRATFMKPEEEKAYDLRFKSLKIGCLIRTFETAGFRKIDGNSWNAHWGKPKHDRVKEMNKYQKTNHFPGCWHLGRKDNLWRNLSRMKRSFPNDYNFVPNTYLLSSDFQRFTALKDSSEGKALWIMKPCASACGRGIKLISKKTKIKKKVNYLISEYIANPHLINGFKYDLRLYVFVSCYDPLRIYLYKDGLVRFATKEYTTNLKSVKERYIHLTNWSVNKMSENFVKNTTATKDDEGSKWSIQALRKKYQEMGIDHEELWKKIEDLIIKTIISAEPSMLSSLNRTPEHRNNCYELYGFDVLVDSNLKPWLMEVNVCPSLNSSTPLDKKIKTSVLCDSMNLLGYQPYDRKKLEEEKKNKTPGMEGRKYQPKNVNDVAELNEQNCLEVLSSDDWNVLFETDEEWYRKGDYERIFPNRENVDTYAKFFEFPRYNNTIVWRWLKSSENFLEKICPKVASMPV